MVQAPDLGWVPSPQSLYRLRIEQYEALVASGVFTKRDRSHLINGSLVAKMTQDPSHSAAGVATGLAIQSLLAGGWFVRPDKPCGSPTIPDSRWKKPRGPVHPKASRGGE